MTFARFHAQPEHDSGANMRNLRDLRSDSPPIGDGCQTHAVTSEEVSARWRRVEAIIAATPEDDHDAQWSVVSVCPCCCGPTRVETLLCSRCEGADLDELRKAPPCSVCGGMADRISIVGRQWRCADHLNVEPR